MGQGAIDVAGRARHSPNARSRPDPVAWDHAVHRPGLIVGMPCPYPVRQVGVYSMELVLRLRTVQRSAPSWTNTAPMANSGETGKTFRLDQMSEST